MLRNVVTRPASDRGSIRSIFIHIELVPISGGGLALRCRGTTNEEAGGWGLRLSGVDSQQGRGRGWGEGCGAMGARGREVTTCYGGLLTGVQSSMSLIATIAGAGGGRC